MPTELTRLTRRLEGVVCAAALALLAPAPAESQPVPKGKWLQISTEHFEVLGNAGPGKMQDIVEEVDLLRQVLEKIGTDQPAQSTRPLTIIIFRNEDAFGPYMRSPPVKGTVRSWEGHYGHTRDYLLLNGSRPTGELLPWAYSAYAHHFLADRHPGLPFWLRKGMSSFYATAQVDRRGTVRLGYPDRQDLQTLRERSTLPLRQFFQIDRTSGFLGTRLGVSVYQAQAWAVTHFITTGGGLGPAKGSHFFRLVSSGLSEEEAIRTAFDADFESFEKALRGYINSPTMPVFTLKDQAFTTVPTEPAPIAPGETAYQLGLYLAIAHEPPPARLTEEHLLPLVEGSERAGDALATMGELRRRSGRVDDATAFFERAQAATPSSVASHYFIARHFLAQDPLAYRDRVRAALHSAIALAPGFGEAYALLDQTFSDDENDQAIANLEKAVELLADRPDLAYSLVIRHLNAGDLDGARAVVAGRLSGASAADYRNRSLRHIENRSEALDRQRRFDAFNRAVELYNRRDFAGAREQVDALLEEGVGGQLEIQARELLEAIDTAEARSSGRTSS